MRWTVIVEWKSEACEDADEIVVHAKTAAGAASKARAAWLSTNGPAKNMTEIQRVFVMTREKKREFD